MKQLTITKAGGRILELNVSQKAEGFTPRDSRKWHKIADKIITAIQDYDTPVQDLVEEAQTVAFSDDYTPAERDDEVRRINAEIRDLDETKGKDEVKIVLESDEFAFIGSAWWDLKFPADRRTRAMTGAVSDALDAAIEVKVEDGHVVPVEKPDSAPAPKTDRKRLSRVK